METIKHKVEFSKTSFAVTIGVPLLYGATMVWFAYRDQMFLVYLLAAALVIFSVMALYYAPLWISVSDEWLEIGRSLRIKQIPMDEIAAVSDVHRPMGERRICGSGGYCGYWGWFRTQLDGRYFGYYGRPQDCFKIVLRDGHQYMLSCKDPQPIVDFISSHIQKRKNAQA